MTVYDLRKQLEYYNPDAKVVFMTGFMQPAELLSMYSKNQDPKDKTVFIDIGSDED